MAGAALASPEMVAAAAELGFSLRPGFRFHPTDQELAGWFLRSKVLGHGRLHIDFIPEVNVYRFEPHELPDKSFSPSTGDPGAKVVWYFLVPRGRKYPTGLRMERATLNGFWKSTGKDRPIMHNGTIIGMKKTLVYHTGRAPRGTRTNWVMHEYRLHPHLPIHDTYALCRVFNRNMMTPSPFLLASVDMDNEGIQRVSVGPNANKDEMQPISGGTDADKEVIHPLSVGPDANKDVMQPMSVGVDLDKEGMHSVPNDADMDKEGIPSMSDGSEANKERIQPVFDNANADKEWINPVSGSVGVDMEGIHPVSGSIVMDMERMHPVFGRAFAHNEELDPMSGSVYTDVDFSWMQFVPDDICYPSTELDKDDHCTQLINDYMW